ncbi:NAD(P)/FAD-dependent oxidoreductase [Schleiferia thermophila]|uniref:NAD(P)/FAD-dependent oxidoreductase n=1 Tax=Schleiferia thermophila TaxID=884107 RepID=UPI003EEB4FC0
MKHMLLVGQGIAGSTLALLAEERGIRVTCIGLPGLSNSSAVASGIWNPIVLKRMTLVWRAAEMLEALEAFYPKAQALTEEVFFHPMPVYRIFHSPAEVNEWQVKSTLPLWNTLLISDPVELPAYIRAPYGAGKVLRTGYVNTVKYIEGVQRRLQFLEWAFYEQFFYDKLKIKDSGVEYLGLWYDGVVFADGMYAWQHNPWFPRTWMRPTRGDVLTLTDLPADWNFILHFSHFVVPLADGQWKLGATYDFKRPTPQPNLLMAGQMLDELKSVAEVTPVVTKAEAGVRPNTKDRRPMIGSHPEHPQVFFINGLGSRGVLLAPKLSEWLLDWITEGSPVPEEADIKRCFPKNKD